MKTFIKNIVIAIVISPLIVLPISLSASSLHLEVFTSSPESFQATSTLIYGDKDLILIDAQLTLSQAHQVVEQIKATGKNLTTVYITHGHPDHYWGLSAIREAFPTAKFVATPETVATIKRIQADKVAQWKPVYGDDIPDSPLIPEEIQGKELTLEGNVLEIFSGVQGDTEGSSFVWVPSIKAVVAGDIVYNNVHIWVLETDQKGRKRWIKTLNKITKLNPEIVVAGHKDPLSKDDTTAVAFTRNYLIAFDKAAANSRSAEELMTTIEAQFPNLGLEGILQMAANQIFPKSNGTKSK